MSNKKDFSSATDGQLKAIINNRYASKEDIEAAEEEIKKREIERYAGYRGGY